MRVSNLSSLVLTVVFVTGCGVNTQSSNLNTGSNNHVDNQTEIKTIFKPVLLTKEDISKLDKEYMTFNTKALTVSYIQKKLLSLIGNDNGIAKGSVIVKELMYYKEKAESIIPFKAMCAANPNLYIALTNVTAVINQRAVDIPFDIFMGGVNPLSAPVANAVSAITSTGFTANWSVVANASSGYVLTIKQGTTTVSTINVSGQATSSYVVTGLNSSTAYTYNVKANNGSLLSISSNSISVSTLFSVINYTSVGTYAGSNQGYQDGNAISAQFYNINGITIDSDGNLYVADTKNNRIRKIANDVNHTVSTIAGSTQGYQDGNGTSAKFYEPTGITIDSDGNLYITDYQNNKIRKIANDANHTVSTYAGSSYGYQDGNGNIAQFSSPYQLKIDSMGNLYVTDMGNHRIRKIANDANHTVSTYAGNGSNNYVDGNGTSAQFYYPTGITIDPSGNLYISDTNNNVIRKIANDANHTVSTYAGTYFGYQDGNGNSAKFFSPNGITIDPVGNLYVSDLNNNKIRKIANDVNHTVSTIAGSTLGYQNGNSTSAKFSYPSGIIIDPSGNLYVSDSGNNIIRKVQ